MFDNPWEKSAMQSNIRVLKERVEELEIKVEKLMELNKLEWSKEPHFKEKK